MKNSDRLLDYMQVHVRGYLNNRQAFLILHDKKVMFGSKRVLNAFAMPNDIMLLLVDERTGKQSWQFVNQQPSRHNASTCRTLCHMIESGELSHKKCNMRAWNCMWAWNKEMLNLCINQSKEDYLKTIK